MTTENEKKPDVWEAVVELQTPALPELPYWRWSLLRNAVVVAIGREETRDLALGAARSARSSMIRRLIGATSPTRVRLG